MMIGSCAKLAVFVLIDVAAIYLNYAEGCHCTIAIQAFSACNDKLRRIFFDKIWIFSTPLSYFSSLLHVTWYKKKGSLACYQGLVGARAGFPKVELPVEEGHSESSSCLTPGTLRGRQVFANMRVNVEKERILFWFRSFFQECISIHIGQAGVQMGNACWYKDSMEYCQNTTLSQKSPNSF